MKTFDRRLDSARIALKAGLGVGPFLAGLDKFFNLLADWPHYVSPLAARVLPMSPQAFMYVVGVIEMAVGLAVLTRWTRLGSYIAMVWLVCIAVNLVSAGFLDIAVRDLEMAIAAYTLARLTEAHEAAGHASAVASSETSPPGRIGAAA
jgi:uncharacterized membrane protein YphA (DoxX/SURF4 family)